MTVIPNKPAPDSPLLRQALINDRLEQIEQAAALQVQVLEVFEKLGVRTPTEEQLAESIRSNLFVTTVLIQELRKL